MAFLLAGERSIGAAASFSPVPAIVTWFKHYAAKRAEKAAMTNLATLDAHLLSDIGVSRNDVLRAQRGEIRLSEHRVDYLRAGRRSS